MKVSIVGAGGLRTPLLLGGLLEHRSALGLTEVGLWDVDRPRLDVVRRILRHQARGTGVALSAPPTAAEALAGSLAVFFAVRVGGMAARLLDETIPPRFGLLGQETVGAGGIAMALRTIPVALHYAELARQVAPGALFLNLTNPAGAVTQALRDQGHPAVGLCDTPSGLAEELATFFGSPVRLRSAGLNHLGFVWSVVVDGEERLPWILEHYEEVARHVRALAFFPGDFVRALGALPTEYLLFYVEPGASRRRLTAAGGRARLLQAEEAALLREAPSLDDEALHRAYVAFVVRRRSTYLAVESGQGERRLSPEEALHRGGYHGLAVEVLMGVRGQPVERVLNVPSAGRLPGLAADEVAELPCHVGPDGIEPLPCPPLPPPAAALVRAVKESERLAVKAALTGDRAAAALALFTHPLGGGWAASRAAMAALLDAHRGHLPQFAP